VKRVAIAAMWAVGGYLVGAFGGGILINALSSNQFDRSVEAAMTGAFVTGPLGGVTAFIVGFVRSGRTKPRGS
jgi:hypothetical protein